MANVKSNKKGTKTKKRVNRNIDRGQCHIKTSFNNTIVVFTDVQGNAISWCSAGKLGLKGSKKSTPFAAQTCVEEAGKVAKDNGLKYVDVFVKGPGSGRESAIRALGTLEFEVTMIKDVSPIAHNGCRPPKRRRV
ncbi:MAG: 30S ribosomal protein S11 [Candidatus Gastranaerophilales bacterium]|nr:30S ribosomal protein S11 [Clostridia bacterium]MBQ8886702.1 30S ribosomal protein S11 [Candidatus Gastranaerophilales bacterium]